MNKPTSKQQNSQPASQPASQTDKQTDRQYLKLNIEYLKNKLKCKSTSTYILNEAIIVIN